MNGPRRYDRTRYEDGHEPSIARRGFLAASAGALAAGLAGCSEVTSHEFEADPVGLPEDVREEFGLVETFTDSRTTTRELTVAGQDVEVTITNRFAGYYRSKTGEILWSTHRPTLVQRFAGIGREATPGSGSAINAVAGDLGFDQSNPSYVEGDTPVSGDRITLVVPERARHDGEVRLAEVMALHHADALPVDELTSSGGNNYLVDLPQVLPDRGFLPGSSGYEPDDRWVAGHEGHWLTDDPSSLRCLVCLGEFSPETVFGIEEMPGRRIEDGETVDVEDTLLFAPAPKEDLSPAPEVGGLLDPTEVFDAGYPSPVGGPTYAVAVTATPNAEVADQSVNPLAHVGPGELLTGDRAREVLADAGLTDAEEVEWLRGPERLSSDSGGQDLRRASLCPGAACTRPRQVTWLPFDDVTVLGEEVGVEVHGGVVSGLEGPWAVGVHVARAAGDDVVVPVAVHRRPVGTPDGRVLFGDGGGFLDREWTIRALELTSVVFGSLERTSGEA